MPHGIIAGTSGSGKTNLIRCIVHQAIMKKFNVSVLDFKGGGDYSGVERENAKYSGFEDYSSSFIISEPQEARELLLALTIEVKARAAEYKEYCVANIDEFNKLGKGRHIPYFLVIDEAAEIVDKAKNKDEKELYNDINQYLRTLARTSRAAGVHILMGIIRPDSNVLDGQIKNNLLWRACGYFADSAASRIVLDNDKATEIPPNVKGRFIIGEDETQAYYLPLPKSGDNV